MKLEIRICQSGQVLRMPSGSTEADKYRNPKQIRIYNAPMTNTGASPENGVFSFGSFEFISNFEFRISNLE